MINFRRKSNRTTGYTRAFISSILALVGILGLLFVVLRLSNTAPQKIVEANSVPVISTAPQEANLVANVSVIGQTEDVLPVAISPEMLEQIQMMKLGFEKDYNVTIDFVNTSLVMPREAYDAIIKITNELSGSERYGKEVLESIAKDVSTEFNPVTLINMKDYVVLRATIGDNTYVLKKMSKMSSENANDNLAMKFNSPYIAEVLMTLKNGPEDWMVMEYVGPSIPPFDAVFTEEEIKLLIRDCFLGLDAIHKNGYFHKDLFQRNIVYVKDEKGMTVGFKIIDLGMSEARDRSLIESFELYDEVRGVLMMIKNYLRRRVNMRPRGVGYMETVDIGAIMYSEVGPLAFLEEDFILADFVMTAIGRVTKPATCATDLLKHQYITGTNADLFGERLWTVAKRLYNGSPVS